MKRRNFLKVLGIGGTAAALPASVLAYEGPEEVIPEYKIGTNILSKDVVSTDVNDFIITTDRYTKLIDIIPRIPHRPHLTVRALHRHLCDLGDRVAVSASDIMDISDPYATQLITQSTIGVVNGWTTTQRTKRVLVGGIEEGGVKYCTVELIGEMDYTLTRNIRITGNDGKEYQYNKTGYERIVVADGMKNNIAYIEYDAYKNTEYVYDENTRRLEPQYGQWHSHKWEFNTLPGITVVPVYSMG